MLSWISNCAEVCLLILVGCFVPIVIPMRVCAGSCCALLENLETCFVHFE